MQCRILLYILIVIEWKRTGNESGPGHMGSFFKPCLQLINVVFIEKLEKRVYVFYLYFTVILKPQFQGDSRTKNMWIFM